MRGQILLRIDLGVALIAFFWAPCLGLHAGVQGVPGSVGTSLHDLKILETHDFYLGRRDKRVLRLDKARVVGLNHGGNLTTQEQPDPVEWEGPLRLTPLCRSHVRKYQELLGDPASTLADGNWWAFKMLDANGVKPGHQLSGNTDAYGSFRSCLDVDVSSDPKVKFRGQYAGVLEFDPAFMMLNFLALCVPDSCRDTDLYLLQATHNGAGGGFKPFFVLPPHLPGQVHQLDTSEKLMIGFLALLGGLILAATLVEGWQMYDTGRRKSRGGEQPEAAPGSVQGGGFLVRLLLGFSLYSNCQSFAKIYRGSSSSSAAERLSCLEGMRFLSMTWVVMGHCYTIFGSQLATTNTAFAFSELLNQPLTQTVLNAYVSVDTFFVISGCLVSYLTLKQLEKAKGRMNVALIYLHRYLRLTGPYGFLVLLHMSLVRYLDVLPRSGVGRLVDGCKEFGWKNFLYIGIYDTDGQEGPSDQLKCLGQAWYLDCDMQMFLVIPLILYPLWKFEKVGILLTVLATLTSVAVPTAMTVTQDWPPTLIFSVFNYDYFYNNYIVPWHRFSPYMAGIVVGFVLFKTRNVQIKIKRVVHLSIWAAAFATALAVLYGLDYPRMLGTGTYYPLSPAATAMYGGMHRLAWGLCIAWVIFACSRGYGGWINQFLSWEAFQPLSKLTFLIYLTHLTVLPVFGYSARNGVSMSHFTAIIFWIATLVISGFFSFLIHVGFELPWLNSEKLIFAHLLGKNKKA